MITLIIFALIVIGIIYLAFFGIFKLIWLLCKSHRNVWPLILAGVGTLLFCSMTAWGMWWGAQKLITPFKQMLARTKANPEQIFGPRVYQDERFPFALTVFDGMDFSEWISFKDTYVKFGIDTNAFKKKTSDSNSPLAMLLIRTPIENQDDPFEQWKHFKNEPNAKMHFKILREEPAIVNGLSTYHIDGVAYSNRGPVDVKMTLVNDEEKALYYLILLEMGNEDKTSQIETIRESFKRTDKSVAITGEENPLPQTIPPATQTQETPLSAPITLATPQPAQ